MHKKIWLILGSVFLGVGLILAAVALTIYGFTATRRNRVLNDSIPITAVIVDITSGAGGDGEMHRRAYIEYEIGQELFVVPLRWWTSGMFVGQPVEIHVNRQDPRQFVTDGMLQWLPVLIILPLGGLFGIIGAAFLLVHVKKRSRQRWLLDFGTPVWANVLGLEENWHIRINGRPATVLIATYNNMRFVSGPVDNNDLVNIGDHVKVLLHPENNNRYAFDFMNESHLIPLEQPKPLQNG